MTKRIDRKTAYAAMKRGMASWIWDLGGRTSETSQQGRLCRRGSHAGGALRPPNQGEEEENSRVLAGGHQDTQVPPR